jgi:inhibitor of cysteine peptidase
MRRIYGIIAVLLLAACIAGTGCVSEQTGPTEVTPSPTGTAAPVETTPTVPPMSFVFNETANGTTESVPVGSNVTIRLDENPTTGYQWNATVSAGLKPLEENFIPSDTTGQLVGAGGIREWVFEAETVGNATFDAVYIRSWEPITGTEDSFGMAFTIVE